MDDNERIVLVTLLWVIATIVVGCTVAYQVKEAAWKLHWGPQLEQRYVFPRTPSGSY